MIDVLILKVRKKGVFDYNCLVTKFCVIHNSDCKLYIILGMEVIYFEFWVFGVGSL